MQYYDYLKIKDICSRKNYIYFENYYKSLFDLTQRIFKQNLNSIYGRKIFNKKENKTMTNFQWLASDDERVKEFINNADKLSILNFYDKYGIPDIYASSVSDVFKWLLMERVPPKTECYDFYKLIKFVSNPALFSTEETTDILSYIIKLDNFRYHKGYGEYSVAVKKDNAIDIIFNGKLRANRKSLVTEKLNALPVIKLDLNNTARSV